jgi:hypothetical protein
MPANVLELSICTSMICDIPATSRLSEKLPKVIELAAVTGHQTIQMLKRYYHPKAEAMAQKLG